MFNFLKEFFSGLSAADKGLLSFATLVIFAHKLAVFAALLVLAYYLYSIYNRLK